MTNDNLKLQTRGNCMYPHDYHPHQRCYMRSPHRPAPKPQLWELHRQEHQPILQDKHDPAEGYVRQLRAAVRCMLEKSHYPCSDEEGKHYIRIVSPENIRNLIWLLDTAVCQRDFIAREASRLAARMEGIGLGHVNDNKFDWLEAARDFASKACRRPRPWHVPPSPHFEEYTNHHPHPKPPLHDFDDNCYCDDFHPQHGPHPHHHHHDGHAHIGRHHHGPHGYAYPCYFNEPTGGSSCGTTGDCSTCKYCQDSTTGGDDTATGGDTNVPSDTEGTI